MSTGPYPPTPPASLIVGRSQKMDFLKNISVNLKATGPAAILVSLVICITLLGIFGESEQSKTALSTLSFISGLAFVSFGWSSQK